jgi:hypothetical protein
VTSLTKAKKQRTKKKTTEPDREQKPEPGEAGDAAGRIEKRNI